MCHGGHMSIFSWIGGLFEPAAAVVDELHYSGEEKGHHQEKMAKHKAKMSELKNHMAQIEAKVATKTLELQSQILMTTLELRR